MKFPSVLIACLGLVSLVPARAQSPGPTQPASSTAAPAAVSVQPPAASQPSAVVQPPSSAPQRLTLGVSDIQVVPGLLGTARRSRTAGSLNRISQAMGSQLIASLAANDKFQIVSRSDLAAVLKEQGLSQSGNINPSSLIKSFKLAGAKIILVATIDNFEDRIESGNFGTAGSAQNRKVNLSCVGKLYNAETGNITASTDYQLTDADVHNNPSNITSHGGAWADDLLINLTRMMAEKIALRTTDILYPAKVIAKTDNQITINRGDGTGIAPGQIWIIYATGKTLIDPDTGENLGPEEIPIGKARITFVTPRTTSAEIIEDHGVGLLDIARLDTTAPALAAAPTPASTTSK